MIDGAHVPGHLSLNLHELGCDLYAAACHKWLCC
jgi:isopenicillin-N epimerase